MWNPENLELIKVLCRMMFTQAEVRGGWAKWKVREQGISGQKV